MRIYYVFAEEIQGDNGAFKLKETNDIPKNIFVWH